MTTAIQDLILDLDKIKKHLTQKTEIQTIQIIIDTAKNKYLQKEKEQIKTVFNDGADWELYGYNITQEERAEKYYNELFNCKVE